jgi:hypothetical protein
VTDFAETKETSAVLGEAAGLEAAGRPLDAIRLLTAANRASRDIEIERRLVMLRHTAFETLERFDVATLPPPVSAAPGPPGPMPELAPAQLTVKALRDGLATHGCVLVRGLVPEPRALELAAGIDAALAAFDAFDAGTAAEADEVWYHRFTPPPGKYRAGGRNNWIRASGSVWAAESPRMLFELLELVGQLGVADLIGEHLGECPALSINKCTLRRVPIDSNTAWHQDGAFLGAQVRTVNLWLALSHCGTDAPGLEILPRRLDHVVETGTGGAIFDWCVGDEVVAELARETPTLRPQFAPGDAMLFDHMFLHRTAVSEQMTKERHAIETWFFGPSAYPAQGQIPMAL